MVAQVRSLGPISNFAPMQHPKVQLGKSFESASLDPPGTRPLVLSPEAWPPPEALPSEQSLAESSEARLSPEARPPKARPPEPPEQYPITIELGQYFATSLTPPGFDTWDKGLGKISVLIGDPLSGFVSDPLDLSLGSSSFHNHVDNQTPLRLVSFGLGLMDKLVSVGPIDKQSSSHGPVHSAGLVSYGPLFDLCRPDQPAQQSPIQPSSASPASLPDSTIPENHLSFFQPTFPSYHTPSLYSNTSHSPRKSLSISKSLRCHPYPSSSQVSATRGCASIITIYPSPLSESKCLTGHKRKTGSDVSDLLYPPSKRFATSRSFQDTLAF